MSGRIMAAVLAVAAVVLAGLVVQRIRDDDTAARLEAMEAYAEDVSPGLCAELDRWATERGWPTWLCGPTSWAMATELDRRFFAGELPIVATPTGGDCIVMRLGVARTPLGGGQYHYTEHVWIEIHWRGLIILVDPTYSQFDRLNTVVFAWFDDDADGRRRLALFRELLHLDDATPANVLALDDPTLYVSEAARVARLLDGGDAPMPWHLWAAWMQRCGAMKTTYPYAIDSIATR